MAANLTRPEDYSSTKQHDGQKLQLLPPSSFEGPRQADPWRELVQATNEVLQLKVENKQLRDSKQKAAPVCEEIKERFDREQAPPPHHNPPIGVHHLDDIINRQAADICELKKQLSQSEARCQREAARLQSQAMLSDAQHTHKVAALEAELQQSNISHQSEIDRKTAEHARLESEYVANMSVLQEKLSTLTEQHDTEVDSLQSQLTQSRQATSDNESKLDALVKEQAKTLREQEEKLSQLKLYLSETQDNSKSTEIWRKETQDLRYQLEQCEKEKESVESSLQLLNIRLASQTQILNVQEKELLKVKGASTDKKKHCLLTRWREKVYQLLVQLKCQELVLKDEDRKWALKVAEIENQLAVSDNKCQVLEHSLADKQAQLDMGQQSVQRLQDDLTKAQQVALMLDDRIKEDGQKLDSLGTLVAGVQERFSHAEQAMCGAIKTLGSHSQRLGFASGRVQMLQAQFARRDARLRLQIKDEEAEHPTRDPGLDQLDSPVREQLSFELERVTEERDRLAEQLREDSQLLENKVEAARAQYAEEVELLRQRTGQLHQLLEEKTQKCESQSEQLAVAQTECAEAQDSIESLKIQLAKVQLTAQKDVEIQRSADQVSFTEQLAEMEHKLNDARREHTKAVVSWRQLERQSARDKERATEHAQVLEEHYKQQLKNLEVKARSLEKERNLLMATLRQEGLIGKYKAQRSSPVMLDPDVAADTSGVAMETVAIGDSQVSSRDGSVRAVSPFTIPDAQPEEPLHAVIDDLKMLTAEVMNSSDDDDDDDDADVSD